MTETQIRATAMEFALRARAMGGGIVLDSDLIATATAIYNFLTATSAGQ